MNAEVNSCIINIAYNTTQIIKGILQTKNTMKNNNKKVSYPRNRSWRNILPVRYEHHLHIKKGKLLPLQAVEVYNVRCRASHIVQTVGSQVAMRLSALLTGRALHPA
jgi:hypothetical protein